MGVIIPIQIVIRHPPPVTILPIFLCLPLLVRGIPIERDIFDFAEEIPINRFHEKPPLFIFVFPPGINAKYDTRHEKNLGLM